MRFVTALILAIHLTWILWVIFGAFWTRGRPGLTAFHLASLAWGIIVEIGPWPCPLTLLEQHVEVLAGAHGFSGGFIAHYLQLIVYPNLPVSLIAWSGVAVCVVNLLIYLSRFVRFLRQRHSTAS